MATAAAFTSEREYNMEISSPANRVLDDDIDIDFDDYTGGVHVADDEQMIEDADPARPTTSTDDMMEDDVLPGEQISVEEEVMQDDGVQVQEIPPEDDEELIDYGDEEIHEAAVEDTVIPEEIEEPEEAPVTTETGHEEADEDTTHVQGFAIPTNAPPGLVEEGNEVEVQFPNPQAILEDLSDNAASLEDGVHTEADAAFADELHDFEAPEQAVQRSQDPVEANTAAAQAPISVNTALSTQADTPGTPTDTGLHPMTIRYGDLRMPLFKSRRQPDGLLKDDNLASLSLAELIQNCRQRLAIKIGEDVSEDQELVLGFEHLGLMLVEDSRAAFESSLNDVLDVYLQLHRNDSALEIPALSLTLSLQLKFASSFSLLKRAAAGGQGMSSFGFLQPLAEEEFYHEEYEDDEGAALFGKDNGEHQSGDDPHDNQATRTDHGYLTEDGQPFDHFEEDGGDYYQEGHYETEEGDHKDASKETHIDNQDTAPPGLEELLQGGHHLTDTINSALDDTTAAHKDAVSASTAGRLDTALGETGESLSRESSMTERGDHVNVNAANPSSGQDDFSTFLSEFEAEEEGAPLLKDDQSNLAESYTRQEGSVRPQGEDSDQTFDAQHLGSEDFLDDLVEHDYEGQGHLDGQGVDDNYEPGVEYGQFDEEYHDQADTYGEQQYEEEDHPDYQPGDEDEQFHTAQQDFFQRDSYEHGPEHDAHHDEEDDLDDTVGTVVHHQIEEDYQEDAQEDFEDDLGFDDETFEEQEEDGKAIRPAIPASPLGNKRSFDDLADEDDLEFDERDVKKSRAS